MRPATGARTAANLVKSFAGSLGLAFAGGLCVGLYHALRGIIGDPTEIAVIASRSVGQVFNAPAEWAVNALLPPGQAADILLSAIEFVVIPYQALAYAGGYCASSIVQIIQILMSSWTFHF